MLTPASAAICSMVVLVESLVGEQAQGDQLELARAGAAAAAAAAPRRGGLAAATALPVNTALPPGPEEFTRTSLAYVTG